MEDQPPARRLSEDASTCIDNFRATISRTHSVNHEGHPGIRGYRSSRARPTRSRPKSPEVTALVSHVAGFPHERERQVTGSDKAAERRDAAVSAPTMTSAATRSANAAGIRGRSAAPQPLADTRRSALSPVSGVGFAAVAVAGDTVHLGMLALYAAIGGVFFVIQAGLLARHSHQHPCRLNRSVGVGRVSTSAEGSAASTPI
jgi:hypothetical protein